MQIESGKYYKTRDGRKVGPMNVPPTDTGWAKEVIADAVFEGAYEGWFEGGKFCYYGDECGLDLIAEWTDEPAQDNEPTQDDDDGLEYQRQNIPLTAIDHLRKAAELFLQSGNDRAAFDVLGLVIDHER